MAATHSLPISNSAHILQPSTFSPTNKPLTPTTATIPITNQLGPKKEWTIPPRPKPGRKPALNAPPTKRKAQNREAQRAFRERRAAKVGELEDQMKQMSEEVAREQEELRDQIFELRTEIEKWQSIAEGWKRECEKVQGMLDHERQSKQQVEQRFRIVGEDMEGSTNAVPLKPRIRRHGAPPGEHQDSTPKEDGVMEGITCGKCSTSSRCQCIEDAFEMSDIATGSADNYGVQRTLSQQDSRNGAKRAREDTVSDDEPTEIDFTTRKPLSLPNGPSSSSSPAAATALDSCGFCQDGTACICAEINRQNENEQTSKQTAQEVTSAAVHQMSSSCTNNPGTCTQCQAIPESKSFCTSVAASRLAVSNPPDSKTGNGPSTEPTLNCADAFNRLAQHPNYPQASTQLKTWVPQLATRAVPVGVKSQENSFQDRPAFEIEAASVMNVLKIFDVRFGEHLPKKDGDQQN